jgi:4'-phosphopantetheinyl transferase
MEWQSRPQIGPPANAEVHVWRATLSRPAAVVARLWHALDGAERDRALRLAGPVARTRFIVARGTLRQLLGGYLGVEATEIRIGYGSCGKPELRGAGGPPALHFSVSHSADVALFAFASDRELGVDLERIRRVPRMQHILQRYFHRSTHRLVESRPEEERTAAFMAAWTQREAYVKALGGGMFETEDRLGCVWPLPHAPLLRASHEPGSATRTWSIVPLRPGDGYMAACVAAGRIARVRTFEA